jgi:hypothetical protein
MAWELGNLPEWISADQIGGSLDIYAETTISMAITTSFLNEGIHTFPITIIYNHPDSPTTTIDYCHRCR